MSEPLAIGSIQISQNCYPRVNRNSMSRQIARMEKDQDSTTTPRQILLPPQQSYTQSRHCQPSSSRRSIPDAATARPRSTKLPKTTGSRNDSGRWTNFRRRGMNVTVLHGRFPPVLIIHNIYCTCKYLLRLSCI